MSNTTTTTEPTQILKTKYSRKTAKGTENFTQYELCINGGYYQNGGESIHFPKGTTLPQIKKAYPQYADATVVVMPSETLKGRKAACEEISEVQVMRFGSHREEPAGITIAPPATPEELAADLADPEDAIQTVKQPAAPVNPA